MAKHISRQHSTSKDTLIIVVEQQLGPHAADTGQQDHTDHKDTMDG